MHVSERRRTNPSPDDGLEWASRWQRSGTGAKRCKIPARRSCASPNFLTREMPPPRLRGSWRLSCPPLGGVAQLGERLNGIQEVRGSIPLASMAFSIGVKPGGHEG